MRKHVNAPGTHRHMHTHTHARAHARPHAHVLTHTSLGYNAREIIDGCMSPDKAVMSLTSASP